MEVQGGRGGKLVSCDSDHLRVDFGNAAADDRRSALQNFKNQHGKSRQAQSTVEVSEQKLHVRLRQAGQNNARRDHTLPCGNRQRRMPRRDGRDL